jgi:hypothetical protein
MGSTDEEPAPVPAPRPIGPSVTLREQVALGCRILALEEQGDFGWGHVSARDPEERLRLERLNFAGMGGGAFFDAEPFRLLVRSGHP